MLPITIEIPETFLAEEYRNGYKVTVEKKKMWAVQLDLIKLLTQICEENKLHIYACGGTLLGAVRDNGFIPWDDNVDFAMPREDFEALLYYIDDIVKDSDTYAFEYIMKNPDSCKFYGKLINKKTTWKCSSCCYDSINGIAICIHPMDYIPSDDALFNDTLLNLNYLRRMYMIYKHSKSIKDEYSIHDINVEDLQKKCLESYFNILKNASANESEQYCIYDMSKENNHILATKDYYQWGVNETKIHTPTLLAFEFIKIPVPAKYIEACIERFGDDYQIPVESSHHGKASYFNAELPWEDYKKQHPIIVNTTLPIDIELPQNFLKTLTKGEHRVSLTRKETWAIQLDMLSKFITICEENNLQYFADGGTLLGAIRHQGFIPWDDDVDIIMPRSDYDKFLKIAPSLFDKKYSVLARTNYSNYKSHMIKIMNNETTMVTTSYKKSLPNGIFIDVFPMDDVPFNREERNLLYKVSREDRARNIDDILQEFNIENSPYGSIIQLSNDDKEWLRTKTLYENYTTVPFEHINIRVPMNFEAACIEQFGENYMELIDSGMHHETFEVLPYTPWSNYKGKHINLINHGNTIE